MTRRVIRVTKIVVLPAARINSLPRERFRNLEIKYAERLLFYTLRDIQSVN